MKKHILILTVAFVAVFSFGRPVDLYYTEDGKTVKMLRGYPIKADFTIDENGDESWLVSLGHKLGPNGFMPKENKVSIGTLGKSKSTYNVHMDDFLGFGSGIEYVRTIRLQDIAFLVPDTIERFPFVVQLMDGQRGTFFVTNEYSESPGFRMVGDKRVNDFTIIHLKHTLSKSSRPAGSLPGQLGIKALAVAFTDRGMRQAIEYLQRNR